MKRKQDDMDDLLKKIMPDVNDKMIEKWQKDVDPNYVFLREDEKKLRRILRKKKNSKNRKKNVWRIVRIAAAIVIVAIISTNMTMTAVAEKRVNYFAAMCHIYGIEMTEFRYDVIDENVEFVAIEPKYIPEGYKEVHREESLNRMLISYENNSGNSIMWEQFLISEDIVLALDAEYDSENVITLGKDTMTIYTKGDNKYVYLETMNHVFLIYATGLTDDEICKMVEGK